MVATLLSGLPGYSRSGEEKGEVKVHAGFMPEPLFQGTGRQHSPSVVAEGRNKR